MSQSHKETATQMAICFTFLLVLSQCAEAAVLHAKALLSFTAKEKP